MWENKPFQPRSSRKPHRFEPSFQLSRAFCFAYGRSRKRPLGDIFGLANFAVNLTTLAPGAVSSLRHMHSKQNEFIYILEGHPTLISNVGQTPLAPGMCAGFNAANGAAHHLINQTNEATTHLEIGDRNAGDTGTYPDDDIVAILVDGKWRFTHKDGQPY